jgi:uncharacterized protein YdeI (YjbR/CyaY-like superfamily)
MRPAGRRAFDGRPAQTPGAAGERPAALAPDLEARFARHAAAWRFFTAQPPGYRRQCAWFVMSAKRDETRLRRLQIVIEHSAAGRRLDPMRPLRQPVGDSRQASGSR